MDLPSIGKRILGSITPKTNKTIAITGGSSPEEITKWYSSGEKHAVKKVTWELTVHAMYSDINPQEILVRTTCGGYSQNVWVPLKLSAYPEILNAPAGTRMRVQGQIRLVQGEDIYLQDCQAKFLAEDQI